MVNYKPLRESYNVAIAIFIVFLLALLFFCLMFDGHNGWLSGYGDILSGIAAVVSGILLYVTFAFQNRSFKQERFEIMFYNLLEQRLKIIEGVLFKCEDLEGIQFKRKVYQGELAFAKVWRDMKYMQKSLSAPQYMGAMDCEDESNNMLGYLNTPPVDEMVKEALDYCYCKRINYIYGISLKTYNEMKGRVDELAKYRICYEFLLKHKTFVTERYFRLLEVILSLLEEVQEEKYCKILLAQMSKEELQILNCHILVDEGFHKRLVNAGIDKLLESEFEITNK